MPGGLKMARHRASHDAEADEADMIMGLPFIVAIRCRASRRVPAESLSGGGARLVFAADPAAIADRVEMPEEEGIIDLAGAGFVAAGIVGELDMGDARRVLLQVSRDVALHQLHVVDIVLDEEIARPTSSMI